MFLDLIHNISLLLALSISYNFIIRKFTGSKIKQKVFSGFLFSIVTVIGMMSPIKYSEGLIFDGRSVILSMSGLFGGFISGSITAIIAIIYRIYLGGLGSLPGCGVILTSVLSGIILRKIYKSKLYKLKYYHFFILGIAVHIFMLLWMFVLPKPLAFEVLKNISLPVMIIYPFATILLGILLSGQIKLIYSEKSVKKSQKLFDDIFTNINSCIFIKDKDLKYTYANKKTCEIFNCELQDIIGKKDKDFFDEYSVNEIKKSDIPVIKYGKKILREETSLKTNNSDETHYLVIKIPLKDEKGNIYGLCGISTDITELKKYEFEKQNLQNQLIQSEKFSVIGQLSTGIAHEFNNILAIINMNSQLIEIENCEHYDKFYKEAVINILTSVKRGKKIVSNMMSFAKPQKPKKTQCSITKCIEEVLSLQKHQFELDKINIEKIYNFTEKTLLDKTQIEQVLLNLIINARHAIKLNGEGKIKIITESDSNNKNLIIKIQDNGIGIDKNSIEKIFIPFFTTKGAFAKDNIGIQGSGLGLSICKSIIEKHKGSITFESKKNQGTVFIISLPINSEPEIFDNNNVINYTETKNDNNLNILLIDDEPNFIKILEKLLSKFNCNVSSCLTGKNAIELVKKNKYNIIFLDMLLPDMKGKDIFIELKKIDNYVPIVFISGQIGLEIKELKKLGAYDYIQKPFNLSEIKNVINNIR